MEIGDQLFQDKNFINFTSIILALLFILNAYALYLEGQTQRTLSQMERALEENLDLKKANQILSQSNRYLEDQLLTSEAVHRELLERIKILEDENKELFSLIPEGKRSFF